MKLNSRTMKLIGSAAVILAIIGGYFLVITPFVDERNRAAQEIEDAEASVSRLESELARITLVRDGIADIQAIDAEISRNFPSASQIPQFTNEVLAAAARAGLSPEAVTAVTAEVPTLVMPTAPAAPSTDGQVDEMASPVVEDEDPAMTDESDPAAEEEPGSNVAQSSLAEMNVSIAASGTTEQLAAFLRELSNMERAYLISTATLAGEPGEEGSLAVSGKTFLYRPVIFPTDEAPEEETPVEGETQP